MDTNSMYEETVPPVNDVVADAADRAADRGQGLASKAVLAGIGAVATACDTAEGTFDRFVNRGQRLQEEWQDRASEIRQQNVGTTGRMRSYFRSAMDAFLDSVNVPNKADVDTINVKLNILMRKMDDIQIDGIRERAEASEPAPTIVTPATEDLAT